MCTVDNKCQKNKSVEFTLIPLYGELGKKSEEVFLTQNITFEHDTR
jgi:hypothetical protein